MTDEKRVRGWLEQVQHRVKPGEPIANARWHLIATGPQNTNTHVIARSDAIVVQRGIVIASPHAKTIAQLKPAERNEFRYGLLRDMLLMGVEFIFRENKNGDFTGVGVIEELPVSVNHERFLSAFRAVNRSSMMAILHIRRIAGEEI
jgi:hypothetical protein